MSFATRRVVALATSVVLLLLTVADAVVVISSEDVTVAVAAEEPRRLEGLTLEHVLAKHVAFPRESLIERARDARNDGDACVSVEGATCAALRTTEETDKDADTALRPTRTKRSRVSLVRLDDVEDLVKYFKSQGTVGDIGRIAAAADDASAVGERLSALTRAAAQAFADMSAGGRGSSGHDEDEKDDDASVSSISSSQTSSMEETPAETTLRQKSKIPRRLRDTGGSFDGSMKSIPGLRRRTAVFYNTRPSAVSVYWVDFNGREVHYIDVHSRHKGVVKSFQGHVWIVREFDSSQFIAQYLVGDESTRAQAFTIPTT